MSEEPTSTIRRAIQEHGPITFAEFMELALYGPGGFYERPPVGAGEGAHFVTSPHVHPVFAQLLARGLGEVHEALGRPSPLRIVEIGAGDGTLARGLLDELDAIGPVEYVAVERSSGARDALARSPGIAAVHADLSDVEPVDGGVILANELLDNLPFQLLRMTTDGLVEVRVGLAPDDARRFAEVETPCPPELAALAPGGLEPGEEAAIPLHALAFIDTLPERLHRGYALLIDYAATRGASVHGYRAHRIVEDVLQNPGTADITAGVDLPALAERARAHGLLPLGPVTQHEALLALGFETWAREQLELQRAHLDAGEGLEAVRLWSGRSRATLLADPAGLGRLRWLGLATQGLPAPGWLGAAAERRPG